MSFTFSQIPIETVIVITSFLNGFELARLEHVERYLHQLMSRRSFWMARISTKSMSDLKRDEIMASTPYRLRIGVHFEPNHQSETHVVESFDLNEIRSALVAAELFRKKHSNNDVFDLGTYLTFPNLVKVCQEQIKALISNIEICNLDDKEDPGYFYHRIEVEWSASSYGQKVKPGYKFKCLDKTSRDVCVNGKKYLQMIEKSVNSLPFA